MQDHELLFWVRDFKPPLYHEEWYKSFFPFKELNLKKVADVGCGGYPISKYIDAKMDLLLVDPLLNRLIDTEKYVHLSEYKIFSGSILDFDPDEKLDCVVCLNVIDHFNDPTFILIDKFENALLPGGELWLYYDVRPNDANDHKALDSEGILNKMKEKFDIVKIDESVNPTHRGWSGVYKSIRVIARKK
jgi:SAM-dependent methyltransferase